MFFFEKINMISHLAAANLHHLNHNKIRYIQDNAFLNDE
jgi:hypothetical protein